MAEGKEKEKRFDVDGAEALTEIIRQLINRFPGLEEGETITFSTLEGTGGLAMYPTGGAAIEEEKRSVTGKVRQVCLYPFEVGCQAAGMTEKRRAAVKEKLDDLGRWLERLPRSEYPAGSGSRKLLSFARTSPCCLYTDQNDHRQEFWIVGLTAKYENVYQK